MTALVKRIAHTLTVGASVRLTALIFSAFFAAVLFVFALLVLHSCEACALLTNHMHVVCV